MKKFLYAFAFITILGFLSWKIGSPYGGNTFPSTGSVGIGTLSPAYLLEVSGGITRFDSIVKIGGGPTMNYGELDMCRQDGNTMLRVISNASETFFYGTGALSISPGASIPVVYTGGRWVFNQLTDDGATPVQVKGAVALDSIKSGGNTGDVLTKQADGYYKGAPSSGGGTSGSWVPTITTSGGSLTNINVGHAYWIRVGNIVELQIDITFNIGATGNLTYVYFTLPTGLTAASIGAIGGFGALTQSGGVGNTPCNAAGNTTSQGLVNFYPTQAVSGGVSIHCVYTM